MDQTHVALVTGAGSGIGIAIAERLARSGSRLVCADRPGGGAPETARRIKAAGGEAIVVEADLADPGAVVAMIDRAIDDCGRLDVLVNNAGVGRTLRFLDQDLASWHEAIAINVTAPMLAGQRAARDMMARRHGRIVNIASIAGLQAGTGRTAYGTTKAAVIALTRQMAIELGEHGITVNAIAPGPVETPMVKGMHTPKTRLAYAGRTPFHRYGETTEIAAAVNFLASDEASYITGQVIAVDGGISTTLLIADDIRGA